MRHFAILAAATMLATPALAGPSEDFQALTEEYWADVLENAPVFASGLGVEGYDDKLGDLSLEAQDRQAAKAAAFLTRLDAIDDDGLSSADQVNKAILARSLRGAVEGNSFGQRMMLFSTYSGWHQGFAGIADGLALEDAQDYENYLKRLAAYPAYNDAALSVSQQGVDEGYVLPCVVLGNVERTITGVIPEDAKESRLYGPFTKDRPARLSAAEWASLQQRAEALIDGPVRGAYAKHAQWYRDDYQPHCTETVGISALPNGLAYYEHRIREETTTNLSAAEIHQIGLDEVARIRAEMEAVAKSAGYDSREAFIAELRTNPKYYAKTPEELMQYVARETKKIDGLMPSLFGHLPRLPYGIKEIPAEIAEGTTTAYFSPGSPENGIAGFYYVNTSKLDQRPLWEVPALSVHEAVPGHHHQIAIQQELDMPRWRKNGTFFTAFVEGWGLYSERLGIEMGLYDTPAKDMGRLSYEMWRANRLVVDTGLHAFGWSKQRAVDFMLDNTALSPANIDAEVNRYISWPGQALAYKLGELKIRELRKRASEELGDAFSLKDFHDVVLGQGSVPLDVLERQVMDWVEATKAAQ
ncbi:DUF885 domain-containing protein [Sphingomicrobium flavum]|uniref:DUF885 domain-containing protein n=1 Tax=Sphingomicrobium flavum TaxID=1229164 RepID=UPI0021AD6331|nr:DUF885 domain-containing protein [Sphingomicrobium flavum]